MSKFDEDRQQFLVDVKAITKIKEIPFSLMIRQP